MTKPPRTPGPRYLSVYALKIRKQPWAVILQATGPDGKPLWGFRSVDKFKRRPRPGKPPRQVKKFKKGLPNEAEAVAAALELARRTGVPYQIAELSIGPVPPAPPPIGYRPPSPELVAARVDAAMFLAARDRMLEELEERLRGDQKSNEPEGNGAAAKKATGPRRPPPWPLKGSIPPQAHAARVGPRPKSGRSAKPSAPDVNGGRPK